MTDIHLALGTRCARALTLQTLADPEYIKLWADAKDPEFLMKVTRLVNEVAQNYGTTFASDVTNRILALLEEYDETVQETPKGNTNEGK